MTPLPNRLVGLIGKNGSGKSTACSYLGSKGYTVISLSDYVREKAGRDGGTLDRDNLTETANRLKSELGDDVLARKAIEQWSSLGVERVVFDSIRNTSEISFLKSKGVRIVGISADLKERFSRIGKRQHSTDQVDFETFESHDQRESTGESSGQNIDAAFEMSDDVILNDGDLVDLHEAIDALIARELQEKEG
jgi:dephospho-CoA kinase